MSYYDYIVVGLGSIGIATMRELANRDLDVIGIEQGSIVNPDATSYGKSRLFRFGYEDGEYSKILRDAKEDWLKLQSENNRKLFFENGVYQLIHDDNNDHIHKVAETYEDVGLDYEIYNDPDCITDNRLFNVGSEYEAIYQSNSGILDAMGCLNTQVQKLEEENIKMKDHEKVVDWEENNDLIQIKTEHSTYETENLIITTGAWAYEQFDRLKQLISVNIHTYSHFLKCKDQLISDDVGFTFKTSKDKANLYGLVEPSIDAVKIGVYSGNDKLIGYKPSHFTRGLESQDYNPEKEVVNNLFNIPTTRYIRDSCMISETPDDDPIIDKLSDNVTIGVGMSGHGFKHSNIMGRIITDISTDSDSQYATEKFSIDRF